MRFFGVLFLVFFLGNSSSLFAFAKKPADFAESIETKHYACPMQCQLSEKPGECPKCGMEMWEVSQK